MAYNQDVIDYAQNLFLSVDAEGKRQYSYQQIVDEMVQYFGKKKLAKLNRELIRKWAKKFDWEVLFQATKSLAQEQAVKQAAEKEQTIRDAVIDDLAERRKTALQKKKMADFLIMAALKKNVQNVQAGKAMDMDLRVLQVISKNEEDTILNLDGGKQPGNDQEQVFFSSFGEIK